eukprot:scaffold319054_cov30-Tisochrysis_lutea.AAC.2
MVYLHPCGGVHNIYSLNPFSGLLGRDNDKARKVDLIQGKGDIDSALFALGLLSTLNQQSFN